ncbi:hypothetical protein B0T26DRAFT_716734 [Lasiosphaeria miniovina]|uniref:Uncharacterized protein n=1 Tax=Lasiosphaeria miniovina TaxID=1954250 RepID=A0AA40DR83_9PEZI|nr:uncharacterized protein B0T26DRAFT_716734 [Lasiosphaeria miniovina]KAK0713194.1 hypothetical protein B0T26DRAFT_716734 [Lasiosphaeria miniovina]
MLQPPFAIEQPAIYLFRVPLLTIDLTRFDNHPTPLSPPAEYSQVDLETHAWDFVWDSPVEEVVAALPSPVVSSSQSPDSQSTPPRNTYQDFATHTPAGSQDEDFPEASQQQQPQRASRGRPIIICPYALLSGCQFTTRQRRDLGRHVDSVHRKLMLFFCQDPNCPRSAGGGDGWSRKDLRDRHQKLRHSFGHARRQGQGQGCDTGAAGSEEEEEDNSDETETAQEDNLVYQVREERRLRLKLEKELEDLRKRSDEVQRRADEKEEILNRILLGKLKLQGLDRL